MTARELWARLKSLLGSRRNLDDLEEELHAHLAMEIEAAESSGVGRDEAVRRFGNRTTIREGAYESWTFARLESITMDIRLAWRALVNSPGFTAMAVLTLALSIGANSAIMSISDAVLFRPLPYADPDRVHVLLMLDKKTHKQYGFTPQDYLRALGESHSGISKAAVAEGGSALFHNGEPESVPATAVSAEYFQTLGVRPEWGRLLTAGDERAVVLSHGCWQQRFGGDRGVLGRRVHLGEANLEVVGVLPRGFVFPSWAAGRPEFVTLIDPLSASAQAGAVNPVVRLKPGVTRERAQAEIEALICPLAAQKPFAESETIPVLTDVRAQLYPIGRTIMRYLLVAAGLVLLIGCANLANLLLTRTQRREREQGVRAALGASWIRLIRPVIFESVLLGVAAAGLALAITSVGFDTLLQHVPAAAYGNAPVGLSGRVVAFTFALGLLGGLLFAVAPAWLCARLDSLALIRGRTVAGGWSSSRGGGLRNPMLVVQVALSVLLVFGAVIAIREFLAVLRLPLGFRPENVVTIRVAPPAGLTGLGRRDFYLRAISVLASRGDVVAVGAAGTLPLSGAAGDETVTVNRSRDGFAAVHIQPGYFEAAGIRLTAGQWPSGPGEAALAESFARSMLRGSDPLHAVVYDMKGRQYRVTGVVADVRMQPNHPLSGHAYIVSGESTRGLTLLVRTRTRHPTLLSELKREVRALAPGSPVVTAWWEDTIGALTYYRDPRFQTMVLGAFAALALGLTGLGTYGAVAFMVAIRWHEMGIRLAIGAAPRVLIRFLVRQAITPVILGLVIGLTAAFWVGHHRKVYDPSILVLAIVTVAVAALLAAYVPARRVSRIDPTIALRHE